LLPVLRARPQARAAAPSQESLGALFAIPARITVRLLLRQPALAAIPPSVVITRVKSLSLALGQSMQVGDQRSALFLHLTCNHLYSTANSGEI
jgi:hypothetical protein